MKKLVLTICLVALLVGGCHYIGFTGGISDYAIEFSTVDDVRPADPNRLMLLGGMTFGEEFGVYAKIGYEVVADTGLFVNMLAGVSFHRERFSYMYDPDGEGIEEPYLITMSNEREGDLMIGGGITYFINDSGTAIIASYDNKRGVSAGVGFRY